MTELRHDWNIAEIQALFDLPFNDLMFQAQVVHRQHFNPNEVQISQLLSIKTGACPEDCKYCPQSNRYDTGLEKEKLMEIDLVVNEARKAKESGATRFCMGAAWRSPKKKDMPYVTAMVRGVKELGLETCMTLGMLSGEQAEELNEAGLDYYNHNLDTSEEYYEDIITTRTYGDRLNTLSNVRSAGMKVCSGGIVGMGEEAKDRCGLLKSLANLAQHPDSVPINMLVQVEGTPLADLGTIDQIDPFEFIRTIAVARIMMPKSMVRLSAGREDMNDEMQSLAFMAGANSIFYGEKLLTCKNPTENHDHQLFDRLGINSEKLPTQQREEDLAASLEQTVNDVAMDKVFYDAASA
ncbi:Biotin synthase [Sinobacterium norvegicum]|uniref:Biotin synthase n=1 Tax=Sinobacterium norvegicum TaxID=1641715 RepID=A0ABN8EKJ7_9GAMM|nr:biotin synthase BioB [Sinobacterium norvegicum]CAH0991902.1 Biotin synthase [Sinobacterium norvegicum]